MNLNIRGVDEELMKKAKRAASESHQSLKDWVIEAVCAAIRNGGDSEVTVPEERPEEKPVWIRDAEIPGKMCKACGAKVFRVFSSAGPPQVHWRCGGTPSHLIKWPPEEEELKGIFS